MSQKDGGQRAAAQRRGVHVIRRAGEDRVVLVEQDDAAYPVELDIGGIGVAQLLCRFQAVRTPRDERAGRVALVDEKRIAQPPVRGILNDEKRVVAAGGERARQGGRSTQRKNRRGLEMFH